MARFPYGFPDGWFPVMYSDELAAGADRTLRYFDRDLVASRDAAGAASVRRAEEDIRVGETGQLSVLERNGLVMVWYHGGERAPDYEIPAFAEWGAPDWTTAYVRRRWQARTHPQEVLENAVDWDHFQRVHGMPAPQDRHVKCEGKTFRWMVGRSRNIRPIRTTRDDCLVDAFHFGFGFGWLRYNGMYTTVAVMGVTPIDRASVDIRLGVIGKRDGRSDDATRGGLEAYIEGQAAAVELDIPIWESKRYDVAPPSSEPDGSLATLRQWATQFYSGDEARSPVVRRGHDG